MTKYVYFYKISWGSFLEMLTVHMADYDLWIFSIEVNIF